MGAFGRVAGGLANDWAAVRDKRLQQQTEQQTTLLEQANMAQKIKSQLLSDQLAQTASQSQQRKDDLTNQTLEKQLKLMGYDWDKGNYEQDEHGNWQFIIRDTNGDVRKFPAGTPMAAEERNAANDAAMARKKEDELAKSLAMAQKFQNDKALLQMKLTDQDQRLRALRDVSRMDAKQRFGYQNDPDKKTIEGEIREKQAEISRIASILQKGKDPTARTGVLGMFSSNELSDEQRADYVQQQSELVGEIAQRTQMLGLIRAKYDIPVPPGPPRPTEAPAVSGPNNPGAIPPPPKGFTPIAGPNG